MNDMIIGKRITFGAAVGGVVTFAVWLWNVKNPDTIIPAEVAVGLTSAVTAVGQVFIVNLLGVTTGVQD